MWVHASVFVVLHGPDWMLTSFVDRLERAGGRPVRLGEQGTRAEPGHAYLAPGDQHLAVRPGPPTITVTKGPLENFIRPAADPLLRSMAATFGPYGVAVVLTGMGKEGAKGAAHVAAAGGAVLVQDPKSAAAPSMPGTVVNEGLATEIGDLTALAGALGRRIPALSRKLQAASVS